MKSNLVSFQGAIQNYFLPRMNFVLDCQIASLHHLKLKQQKSNIKSGNTKGEVLLYH
jgi:hypothetical protein